MILRLSRNYNRGMAPASTDPNQARALVVSLRDFVVRAKSALDDEIRSYPTPIPRCDAQFNHAYEQRSRLAALLHRIEAATAGEAAADGILRAMAEFAALPPLAESGEERTLRARIADALECAGVQVLASTERGTVDVAAGGH